MAQFFLIDHSLRKKGGHHYDYVDCVARASEELGFETTIATHRTFNQDDFTRVRPVFRETTYQPYSYLAGLRHLTRDSQPLYLEEVESKRTLKRLVQWWKVNRFKRMRMQFIQGFAKDCDRLFRQTTFVEGDHVFFTTVSELELLAIANFLAQNPKTMLAHWHLQFHFNLFEGRTPDYHKQFAVTKAVRSCFDLAAAQTPYHQIHFYVTSETLADQFQRLDVGNFEVLPYPVADCFRPDNNSLNQQDYVKPLRFACPGGIRREKGHIEYLQPLVNKIWEPHLSKGNLQLIVQRPPKKLIQGEKIKLSLPETSLQSQHDDEQATSDAVEYHPHPLPSESYAELIRSTDCGLLFYDSSTYFSRRAGVLGELLSCGKPVIVSAGSWLGDQVKEVNFRHVQETANSDLRSRFLRLNDLTWSQGNVPHPGGIVSFDRQRHPFEFEFELNDNEAGFCIFWDWHWPQENGVYGRIEHLASECVDSDNAISEFDSVQTIGHSETHQVGALFRAAHSNVVKLRIRNAFHDSTASVKNIRIVTLSRQAERIPLGTVGLISADSEQLANCVDEMIEHYEHYRRTAMRFAKKWYLLHQPKRTVTHLLAAENRVYRAA